MRTLLVSIFAMFLSLSAKAAESYNCSAFLPQGEASIIIQDEVGGVQKVKLAFSNKSRNQIYVGTLKVIENSRNGLVAAGNILAYEAHPVIEVNLTGSLKPGPRGVVTFQLYAKGDRRIELGYGNILHCVRQ